jgi:hypothetical protein
VAGDDVASTTAPTHLVKIHLLSGLLAAVEADGAEVHLPATDADDPGFRDVDQPALLDVPRSSASDC